jgi:hypothetical protein
MRPRIRPRGSEAHRSVPRRALGQGSDGLHAFLPLLQFVHACDAASVSTLTSMAQRMRGTYRLTYRVSIAAPTNPSAPIVTPAALKPATAVIPDTSRGAAAWPASPVKRHAPRNGAGSRFGATSEPNVLRMPLPSPFANARKSATAMIPFSLVTKPSTRWPSPKPTIDGMAAHSRPNRFIMVTSR